MILRAMLCVTCLLPVSGMAASQQGFPDRVIRIVAPFAAGGPSDTVARLIASGMSRNLGQSVIVENKPGAGSVVGNQYVAKATPDGYTVLLATSALPISAGLYKSLPYDAGTDLTPVGLIGAAPLVLVVSKTLNVHSAADLVTLIKASPGKYLYGSSGIGSVDQLCAAWFASRLSLDAVHVPYQGAAPAIQDLIVGRTNFMVTTSFPLLPFIKNGSLVPLAVAAPKPIPQLPGVPTMAAAGLPDFDVSVWYALFAPKHTPGDIVAKLNEAMVAAISDPDVARKLQDLGTVTAVDHTPRHLKQFLASEQKRWGDVIEVAKVPKQ
ncbi:hypothetical protein CAL29_24425 [Bordetella genomosp. 10]|uniref:LacI family transcriptional regulator n=1 Tax=Bordetella genomosp. 10 TaxID=1416804 RepID=A0A261S177_9BORD|nr:tripartite tricarboxylate transporter substrate binding protein [Bordetella genomosp. 10]OZI31084.1 hypothetical protein CAL29_24425 [Bordetella genomosp. 10]